MCGACVSKGKSAEMSCISQNTAFNMTVLEKVPRTQYSEKSFHGSRLFFPADLTLRPAGPRRGGFLVEAKIGYRFSDSTGKLPFEGFLNHLLFSESQSPLHIHNLTFRDLHFNMLVRVDMSTGSDSIKNRSTVAKLTCPKILGSSVTLPIYKVQSRFQFTRPIGLNDEYLYKHSLN